MIRAMVSEPLGRPGAGFSRFLQPMGRRKPITAEVGILAYSQNRIFALGDCYTAHQTVCKSCNILSDQVLGGDFRLLHTAESPLLHITGTYKL